MSISESERENVKNFVFIEILFYILAKNKGIVWYDVLLFFYFFQYKYYCD